MALKPECPIHCTWTCSTCGHLRQNVNVFFPELRYVAGLRSGDEWTVKVIGGLGK